MVTINSMTHNIVWSPGITLDAIEQQVILKAYGFFRNNKTQTASALGISIRTLDSKLERYDDDQKARELDTAEEQRKREDFLLRQRGFVQVNQPIASAIPAAPPAPSSPVQVTTLKAESKKSR